MSLRVWLDGLRLGRRILNRMSSTKIFHILLAIVNEVKTYGFLRCLKDLLENPPYSLYKTFSISPKYMRPRLKPTVDKEEKLFHRCVKPGDFVLDAGCGDGRNGLSLTKIKGAS